MASFQLIGAASGAQRDWLFSHVAESRNAGRSVVVFVPEQYTLQAERDLLSGLRLPGLLNLDVISPTKLKVLVREAAGSSGRRDLDEAGRAMAIHQVLQSCASRLTFYARAGGLYGAVPRMDRTLAELREEGLTPDLLEEMALSARNGFQRAKYQDLGLIWRNYDALLQDRFDDPVISWRDLCLRLPESGLFQGKDLYVYGFDTVRPDLRELLLAAAPLCHSISVLLTMSAPGSPSGRVFRVQRESALRLMAVLEEKGIRCTLDYLKAAPPSPGDPLGFLSSRLFSEDRNTYAEDPSPALTLYAAPTPAGEAMAIVDALLSWKKAGIPWSRMAIALPKDVSASPALLSALRRNGIPFFLSRQEEVSRHGVSRLLSSALTCVSQGPATEPLLDIAACGFGALTREEGAALTSYVQRWGIDRGRWREPFTRGEKEEAQEAEFLRLKLLTPLNHLHDALLRAREAGAAAEAVFLFLREEGIDIQLQERQQRLMAEERYTEAVVDRQIWDLLMNLLDQLHDLLQGHRITLKEVASLVIGALDRATLSSLPESEEGVAIGRIGHMLPGKTEALILPGMNEGVMSARSDSLLTDPERRALEESAGQAIGLDSARMGMIVRSDYVRTMSLPEKRLFVSYCLRDESGSALLPGEPVTELRRLFPALREKGGLAAKNLPFSPDSPVLALEGVGPLLRLMADGKMSEAPAPWPDALRSLEQKPETQGLLRQMVSPWLNLTPNHRISPRTAIRLFHGDRVSISRLECFAGCPRQHFLRYGLRPLLPRSFEFTPGDAGNFFHQAMQEYFNRAVLDPDWPRLTEERIASIMDQILDQLTRPWEGGSLREEAAGIWQGEEYLRRARHAASILTRFSANADFRIVGTEMEFGTPEGMPPLVLSLPDGAQIALQGKIDRLDRYQGPEGDYLRVLDLKSSEKNLDPARMDRGEQLQLMIYLRAAERGLPGAEPAGALYFPIQDREVKSPDPESAEAQRMKDVQLQGVVLGDPDVLHAMDRDVSPYSLPKALNQDGSISKNARWALPPRILRQLMDAAVARAAELCSQIRSGDVLASPSVGEQSSPCSFCEYAAVCSRRKADERPLPKDFRYEDVGQSGARETPSAENPV